MTEVTNREIRQHLIASGGARALVDSGGLVWRFGRVAGSDEPQWGFVGHRIEVTGQIAATRRAADDGLTATIENWSRT